MKQEELKYHLFTGLKGRYVKDCHHIKVGEESLLSPATMSKFINGTIQPIFHRLDMLTQEIEHPVTGEKFVPLIKLFDMIKDQITLGYTELYKSPKLQIDDGWNHVLSFDDGHERVEFCYMKNSFELMVNQDWESIEDRFKLHAMLFEWHFWIFDQSVFESGKAIDKSKLTK